MKNFNTKHTSQLYPLATTTLFGTLLQGGYVRGFFQLLLTVDSKKTLEKFPILALEGLPELSSIDKASFVNATESASFISSSINNSQISSTFLKAFLFHHKPVSSAEYQLSSLDFEVDPKFEFWFQ
uniref:Uncharacterized protein n=1 Tax=Glossina palpalis gambiensis TaxID=67801 RepID=A0A1B0B4T7_9MUSC